MTFPTARQADDETPAVYDMTSGANLL